MRKIISNSRKLIAIILAMATVLCLCACGNSKGTLLKAAAAMKDVKSCTYDMDMEIDMTALGMDASVAVKGSADVPENRDVLKLNMNVGLGGDGTDMEIYIENNGDEATVYSNAQAMLFKDVWLKRTMALSAAENEYFKFDGISTFKKYLELADKMEAKGEESIDGTAYLRFDMTLSGEEMAELVKDTNILSMLQSFNTSGEDILTILPEMGSIQASVWIDQDSKIPTIIKVNMTEVVSNILARVAQGNSTPTVENAVVNMKITNINAVEPIEIPAEIKNSALDAENLLNGLMGG